MTDPHTILCAALVKAQSEIQPAIKDSNNPAFRTKYADLGAVWDAAGPALKANDLAVIQLPGRYSDGCLSLTTTIIHKDGGSLSETMSVPVSKADAQGCGSALTYMRRYALAAALGITQEDDDGNAASDTKRDTTPRQNTPARAPQRPTEQVPAPLIADGVLTQHGCLEFVKVFKQHGLKMSESEVVTGIAITAESYPKVIADWLTANPSMTLETLAQAVKESKGAAA